MDTIEFGVELEVAANGDEVIDHLYASGGLADEYRHEYHCGRYGHCELCDPARSTPDWTCQEDCTADAEFISRILESHTDEADEALAILGDALLDGRAEFDSDVGMHVHVNADPFRDEPAAIARLWRLWLCYGNDVANLARGTDHGIRSYAAGTRVTDSQVLGYRTDDERIAEFFDIDAGAAYEMLSPDAARGGRTGRWLSGGTGSSTGTFEFRIWNATRTTWRLRLGVYVSTAIALAALNGYDAHPDSGDNLLAAIGDHLPDDVWMSVYKQLAYHDDTREAA